MRGLSASIKMRFPINTRSKREIKTESGVIIIEIGLAGRKESIRYIDARRREVVAPSRVRPALCWNVYIHLCSAHSHRTRQWVHCVSTWSIPLIEKENAFYFVLNSNAAVPLGRCVWLIPNDWIIEASKMRRKARTTRALSLHRASISDFRRQICGESKHAGCQQEFQSAPYENSNEFGTCKTHVPAERANQHFWLQLGRWNWLNFPQNDQKWRICCRAGSIIHTIRFLVH